MKKFFNNDSIVTGLVLGIGSELLTAALLTAVLLIIGEPPAAHVRWYGAAFVPLIFILQHYAKRRQLLKVTKTLIVVLFVTFIVFMYYLLHNHIIELG